MRLQERIRDVRAVGDELRSMLSGKHPLQHRRQQRGVGFADGGVFGLEGDLSLQNFDDLQLSIEMRHW